MSRPTTRPALPADHEAVVLLNRANQPAVGPLDDDRLALFATDDVRFEVAHLGDELVGLLVVLDEGSEYASPNYRWFAARHERFTYVDRIALARSARGTGLADHWYDVVTAHAEARGSAAVCAEVNVVPPNPRSQAFHRRRGFSPVAELAPYGTDERVSMFELPIR